MRQPIGRRAKQKGERNENRGMIATVRALLDLNVVQHDDSFTD